MQRVLDYIDRHLDADLDLDILSGVAAFSKFHFHRQFTATFGLSVHRYIQLARMPRTLNTLTLSDAKQMLQAGEAKAANLGIPYNIAVVDAGGALIAFTRQDGALAGSIDLAIGKAKTARLFDKTTEYLAELAQPGAPLFGIEQSNGGNVVIFGGGLPVKYDDQIIGAVGTSAGSVEQDIAVAVAAAEAISPNAKP